MLTAAPVPGSVTAAITFIPTKRAIGRWQKQSRCVCSARAPYELVDGDDHRNVPEMQKAPAYRPGLSWNLVAGTGFEPVTFRL